MAKEDTSGFGNDDPLTHDIGDDNGVDDPLTHDIGDDNGVDDPLTHDIGDDRFAAIANLDLSGVRINDTVQQEAATVGVESLERLEELYIAFFNRVPDADGLEYWIGRLKAGDSIRDIAESFYEAGVQFSELTGYRHDMTHGEFVDTVYRNVLGRSDGADDEGLAYWSAELASGRESHGSLVSKILDSAHTFKGDATWGWVADLLENKIAVSNAFAVSLGLNYLTPEDSIAKGIAIAAAVTPTDTQSAIDLIGIGDWQLDPSSTA